MTAPKIYVSPSNQSGNPYATGGTNERAQCAKIAKACVAYLQKAGFRVKCTYADDMVDRVRESNAFGADVHLAIHTNATPNHTVTGGTQVLLYALSGEQKKLGQAVFDRLAPLTPGKSAEKLVAMPDFYECRAAKGMTVYCECEFHDTKTGSDFIRTHTAAIGEAIAQGICDYYGVKPTAAKPAAKSAAKAAAPLYVVQAGAFSSEQGAKAHVAKLKKAGFEAFYVKK